MEIIRYVLIRLQGGFAANQKLFLENDQLLIVVCKLLCYDSHCPRYISAACIKWHHESYTVLWKWINELVELTVLLIFVLIIQNVVVDCARWSWSRDSTFSHHSRPPSNTWILAFLYPLFSPNAFPSIHSNSKICAPCETPMPSFLMSILAVYQAVHPRAWISIP